MLVFCHDLLWKVSNVIEDIYDIEDYWQIIFLMIFSNNMQNVNELKIHINVRKRPGVTMLEYVLQTT